MNLDTFRGAGHFLRLSLLVARRDWRAGLIGLLFPFLIVAVAGLIAIPESQQSAKASSPTVTVAVATPALASLLEHTGFDDIEPKITSDPRASVMTNGADVALAQGPDGSFRIETGLVGDKSAYAVPLLQAALATPAGAPPVAVEHVKASAIGAVPASSSSDLAKALIITIALVCSGIVIAAAGLLAVESDSGQLEAALVLPVDRRAMLLGLLAGEIVTQIVRGLLFILVVGAVLLGIVGLSGDLSSARRLELPFVVLYAMVLTLIGLGSIGLILGARTRRAGRSGTPAAAMVQGAVVLGAGLGLGFHGWERIDALLAVPAVGPASLIQRAVVGLPIATPLLATTAVCVALFLVAARIAEQSLLDGASRSRAV